MRPNQAHPHPPHALPVATKYCSERHTQNCRSPADWTTRTAANSVQSAKALAALAAGAMGASSRAAQIQFAALDGEAPHWLHLKITTMWYGKSDHGQSGDAGVGSSTLLTVVARHM